MERRKSLLFITKLCVAFVVLSTTCCNSKMAAATNVERPAENSGFISIDCGVDVDYIDNVTGIFYKSDRGFISTGTNQEISPGYEIDVPYYAQQLKTVRYFPAGKKNCYTLQPEQGKNHNYYIRIFFHYGDYDGKNVPPSFDLYLGVNRWVTVQFVNASRFSYYGMVYFSSTDTIDVCLVNTGSGIPFISTLELRLLNDSTYRIESGSLKPLLSCDSGSPLGTNARYKDDVYDRIWNPCSFPDVVSINSTAEIDNQGSNDSYKVPVEVQRTAIQPRSGRSSLSYTFAFPNYDLYIYFHFAEIVRNEQGQRREFSISLNGTNYGPYTLEYLKPLTLRPQQSPIRGEIRFSINSTMESELPPVLNAFEIFFVQPPGLSPTYQTDVSAMMAIKKTYKIDREDWQGDPCLPTIVSWTGLNCSIKNHSRIISLNLSSSKLTGEIASAISNLTAIQSLDLSNNELTGAVPEFLAQMPNLTILNLTGNRLTGLVPPSLIDKFNRGQLELSFDGNPNLCQKGSCHQKKKSILIPIIAPLVSISLLLFLIITAVFWRMKRRVATTKESLMKSEKKSIKYREIVHITNNFRDIIGEGGFGKVYLGELKDGTQVAVKLLSRSSRQGYKEFRSEVQLLKIIHHKNLVSLIGYCDEHAKMTLVYEYMANGNLREHLIGTKTEVLNWSERLQIAVDTAQGLEYLHNGCKPPIIHRDLKPSNILLNEKLEAKISDFGLSRAFGTDIDTHVTTRPSGTPGYLDPEFQRTGSLSKKSDVYSFGVLLFELITGQPVIIPGHEYNTHIIQWAEPLIENGDIHKIVDPRLQGEFNSETAWKAVEIARSCVPPTAIQRPDIAQVLAELKVCLAMELDSGSVQNSSHSLDAGLELDIKIAPNPR